MSNNIGFVHSSNEQQRLSISSLTAAYEQLLHVNSYNEDGGRGGRGILNKGRNDCVGMRR